MSEVLRYELGEGKGEVLIEVDETLNVEPVEQRGIALAGKDDDEDEERARKLERALDLSLPAAERVFERVRALGPKSAEVSFGIKISGEVGFIAKASGEAQFGVKLTWAP